MRDKESKLTNEITEQEKLTSRLKIANKNLRDDQTSQSEFETKKSNLHSDIQMVTDEAVLSQGVADKKQLLLENFKRIKQAVAMKQQKREDLISNLSELDHENWKQDHKLSIMLDYIKEVKIEVGSFSFKRIRLSESVTTTVRTIKRNILRYLFDFSAF